MANAKGVDVSHWQGAGDWSPAGLDFIIAKASEGTSADPMYKTHIAKGRYNDLIVGAYAFNRADVNMDAQVDAFIAAAGNVDLYAIDVEEEKVPGTQKFSLAQAKAFISKFKAKTGKPIGLYQSESGYYGTAGQDWHWVAHWGVDAPTRKWNMHQYRGSPLDLDQFNGDAAALTAWVAALNGETVNTFTTPKVPTICTVPKGAKLFKDDALSALAWNIDPARDMPYYGEYEAGKSMVQRTDEKGVATGNMYFVATASCTNIRAVPEVECPPVTDCDEEVALAYDAGAASRDQEVATLKDEKDVLVAENAALTDANVILDKALTSINEDYDELDAKVDAAVALAEEEPAVRIFKLLVD